MKGVAAGERNRGCESKADMVCATARTWLSQEPVHCFSLVQRGFRVPEYHAGVTGPGMPLRIKVAIPSFLWSRGLSKLPCSFQRINEAVLGTFCAAEDRSGCALHFMKKWGEITQFQSWSKKVMMFWGKRGQNQQNDAVACRFC